MKQDIALKRKPGLFAIKEKKNLILFKNHYILNKNITCILFYLQHYEEFDKSFAYMPIKKDT